jgi:hypothetical protein
MDKYLIYPPHHKYKLKNIKFTFDLGKKDFIGPFIYRKTKYWNDLYEIIDNYYYNNNLNKLPKGTILYRTSIYKDPNIIKYSNDKSDVIYFGLDFVIAIWVALEINEKSFEYIPCYLHIYELEKDILYKYLYSLGNDGVPIEIDPKTCIKKACIHPQEILHGNEYPYKGNELGIEITFPIKKFAKTIKYIKPLNTFNIDIDKLKKNKEKYIFEWDPKEALKK